MNKSEEVEVEEVGDEGEGELNHNIIGVMSGDIKKDGVRSGKTKMPKRTKRDQEIITCLVLDWSTHIHLRQDRKLMSLPSMQER
ncbi:hypothetical protein GW17_00046330 [Ensete ventricosum]|nr:hypothetical protein GW17_00046330 [Ensete ventricosum]